MKKIILQFASMMALFSLTNFVMTDEWSKKQTAAWSVVTQSWQYEVAGNGNWPANYIHDDLVSWAPTWPLHRNKI